MRPIVTLPCVLATIAAIAGCQSTPPPRSTLDGSRGVVCPKCEMVWIETLDMNDPYMTTMISEEVMRCPDCESAIAHFFRTGELRHYCDSCEATLWYCETE